VQTLLYSENGPRRNTGRRFIISRDNQTKIDSAQWARSHSYCEVRCAKVTRPQKERAVNIKEGGATR